MEMRRTEPSKLQWCPLVLVFRSKLNSHLSEHMLIGFNFCHAGTGFRKFDATVLQAIQVLNASYISHLCVATMLGQITPTMALISITMSITSLSSVLLLTMLIRTTLASMTVVSNSIWTQRTSKLSVLLHAALIAHVSSHSYAHGCRSWSFRLVSKVRFDKPSDDYCSDTMDIVNCTMTDCFIANIQGDPTMEVSLLSIYLSQGLNTVALCLYFGTDPVPM